MRQWLDLRAPLASDLQHEHIPQRGGHCRRRQLVGQRIPSDRFLARQPSLHRHQQRGLRHGCNLANGHAKRPILRYHLGQQGQQLVYRKSHHGQLGRYFSNQHWLLRRGSCRCHSRRCQNCLKFEFKLK